LAFESRVATPPVFSLSSLRGCFQLVRVLSSALSVTRISAVLVAPLVFWVCSRLVLATSSRALFALWPSLQVSSPPTSIA
jgi:hypothetical protein